VNARLAAVEVKRTRLLERAAREREGVVLALQPLAQPLAFADHCVNAVRYVLSRPPLVAGAALLFAVLRPRRAIKWARRAFGLWQGYRWLTRKAAA
jgi:hypothetical protein